MRKKITVLTGAGISAESGIKTFRDADGLWEGHDVMEVASPQGFARNPKLVLDFYNQRRRQLLEVLPNEAHKALKYLEDYFEVTIITQNVDNLHESAGSSDVIHLHGELLKVRSTKDEDFVVDWKKDLVQGDTCPKGHQLRPHIVWFGEEVPLLEKAAYITSNSDILIIIGTSMQVYPAASLVHYVKPNTPIYFIDPKPSVTTSDYKNITIIPNTAAKTVPDLVEKLISKENQASP
ncbi:SIR2 family NAD-dependent protein deacylase [Costertonia aggregata]|uniref:NAD-dependent protein deacylase n=1 Tax=Costertonia aggregata TaxID=343403 RepID=A0A7H9AK74_9FLAO|nr:NAD-dependent deacylase [Costertonia aggregata]QLG43909.1 NAD-dependent deacylase [Costertonia aggregata]